MIIEMKYHFACNQRETWRQRVGYALRWLACRVDGGWSLSIEMSSLPRLSESDQREIIMAGLTSMRECHREAVRLEAIEMAGRELRPELWEEKTP